MLESHTDGPLQLCFLQFVQLVFVTFAWGVVQHSLVKMALTSMIITVDMAFFFL